MASSSVASSASSACVSTIPTCTGRANLGDRSADPVASEAESSSAGRSAVGFLAVARSLHTETSMRSHLSHYEDVAELEDDILCFLPTVSDLDVFSCELELLDLREQQPLSEAFRTVANGSSSLHGGRTFHLAVPGRRQGKLPQSSSCPGQPARGNCRQSVPCCTFDPARRSGNWHPTCRNCGLAELPATADCQASTFGHESGSY